MTRSQVRAVIAWQATLTLSIAVLVGGPIGPIGAIGERERFLVVRG
jgi:hypothetical protein